MTFEEYWYSCCDFHQCDNCDIKIACAVDKAIAQSAWQAAQPHWNYCKDGLPTEDGNYLIAVLLPYGHRIVLTSDYDANNCDFWEIDPDREIIAWMPLPEVPDINKNNKEQAK